MKELPLVEDHGEGFQGRQVEWGGMIVSYETFPKGSMPHRSSRVCPGTAASLRTGVTSSRDWCV
jgi:hypothetical protein